MEEQKKKMGKNLFDIQLFFKIKNSQQLDLFLHSSMRRVPSLSRSYSWKSSKAGRGTP